MNSCVSREKRLSKRGSRLRKPHLNISRKNKRVKKWSARDSKRKLMLRKDASKLRRRRWSVPASQPKRPTSSSEKRLSLPKRHAEKN